MDHGRRATDDVLSELRITLDLDLPGTARMIEAARFALGDCFAIATAAAHRVPLLTGDPEILERSDLPCEIEDLRSS
jgi:hypothetical protein